MTYPEHTLDDLTRRLGEVPVVVGENSRGMEPALLDAVARAGAEGFGELGVVVLDDHPAQATDLRNLAQDLQLSTGLDTVIVRSPFSGAVVSDIHSRAELESAQYAFLGNPDVPGATHVFIDHVAAAGASWPVFATLVVLAVFAVTVLTAWLAGPRSSGAGLLPWKG